MGVMKPLKGNTDTITSISFSPDGTVIVSGSVDKKIRIWDAKTGGYVMKPHTSDVSSVCFSTDGTHNVSSSWNIGCEDRRVGHEASQDHPHGITSVDFSANETLKRHTSSLGVVPNITSIVSPNSSSVLLNSTAHSWL